LLFFSCWNVVFVPKDKFSYSLKKASVTEDNVLDDIVKKLLINKVKKTEYYEPDEDIISEALDEIKKEEEFNKFVDEIDKEEDMIVIDNIESKVKDIETSDKDIEKDSVKENLIEKDTKKKIDSELLHKNYIKTNLEDYNLFYTSKNNLNLIDLSKNSYNKDLNISSCIGKLNLIEKFLYSRFKNHQIELNNLNQNQVFYNLVYGYFDCTRYEFLEISNKLNLLIVGNRAGDVQFYNLNLYK